MAKLERTALHVSTLTHVQSNFRSCRDTGITWLAMTGLGVDRTMKRAGHDEIDSLRDHLELAGVTPPRLTEDSATRMPVGFRSWRDTGITWSAIDGVDVHKLQRRAGHDDINTTLGYVKEADDRAKLRGGVFPTRPTSSFGQTFGQARKRQFMKTERNECRRRESKSLPTASKRSERTAERVETAESLRPVAEASPGFATVAENLSVALRRAAEAGEWDVVNTLSRQLAELRRPPSEPPVRAVPALPKTARGAS